MRVAPLASVVVALAAVACSSRSAGSAAPSAARARESAHREQLDPSLAAGASKSRKAIIPDYIPCGQHYCDARSSYCEIYLSDVPELPTGHACRPLPSRCRPHGGATPTCDCFPPSTPCLSFCGPMPTGGIQGFHLTCQGVKVPPANRTRQ